MRNFVRLFAIAISFGIVLTIAGVAKPESAKAIIRSGGAHGIAVEVVDATTNRVYSPNTPFQSGKTFRLRFTTSAPGHIYLTNISPSGVRSQIFPQGAENNAFAAGVFEIPAANEKPFQFDQEVGTETVEISTSPATIPNFEAARYNPLLAPASSLGMVVPVGSMASTSTFANSNSAKAISRGDGFTFPTPMGSQDFFRFTISLFHQ